MGKLLNSKYHELLDQYISSAINNFSKSCFQRYWNTSCIEDLYQPLAFVVISSDRCIISFIGRESISRVSSSHFAILSLSSERISTYFLIRLYGVDRLRSISTLGCSSTDPLVLYASYHAFYYPFCSSFEISRTQVSFVEGSNWQLFECFRSNVVKINLHYILRSLLLLIEVLNFVFSLYTFALFFPRLQEMLLTLQIASKWFITDIRE